MTSVLFGLGLIADGISLCAAAQRARHGGLRLAATPLAVGIMLAGVIAQAELAAHAGAPWLVAAMILCLASVCVCAISDSQTGYIFDTITCPSVAFLLILAFIGHAFLPALCGGIAAGGSLMLLRLCSRGGIGWGDVKLALCLGIGFGAQLSITILSLAFLIGGAVATYLLVSGRARRRGSMRFGPYLAAGAVLCSFGTRP